MTLRSLLVSILLMKTNGRFCETNILHCLKQTSEHVAFECEDQSK